METVTGQPIKKIEFFRCPQSLPGVAPLTKKPEDSGYEIENYHIQIRRVKIDSIMQSGVSGSSRRFLLKFNIQRIKYCDLLVK